MQNELDAGDPDGEADDREGEMLDASETCTDHPWPFRKRGGIVEGLRKLSKMYSIAAKSYSHPVFHDAPLVPCRTFSLQTAR
jgi:hypothetical protein